MSRELNNHEYRSRAAPSVMTTSSIPSTAEQAMKPIELCPCCGSRDFTFRKILWDELVKAWGLSPFERDYVDRQQGLGCQACGCNLRSMALALAICRCYGYLATFDRFVTDKRNRPLRVLEINEAGGLTQFLSKFPKHTIARFPQV